MHNDDRFPVLTYILTTNRLNTSPMMLAILGCIAGVEVTKPAIKELCITSDDCLLARHEGEIGMNTMIGSGRDLERNLRGVCNVLEIVGPERAAIMNAVRRW